jgi:hypothetical protein
MAECKTCQTFASAQSASYNNEIGRRPITIVDYTFSGVNEDTCPIAPAEAMQFSTALQHVIETIVNANPKFGTVNPMQG